MNNILKIAVLCFSILISTVSVLAIEKTNGINSIPNKPNSNTDGNEYKPALFPKIKLDEYAIFVDGRYEVFKTKKFEDLELDLKCFKDGIPKCEAYAFSQMKPTNADLEKNKINNFVAAHCHAIYGLNLIALNYKKDEFNFCRFKDGSMVSSWSVFMKKSTLLKNK